MRAQPRPGNELQHEIIGIILAVAGVLSLVTIFTGSGGVVGDFLVNRILNPAAGSGKVLLLAALVALGIWIIVNRRRLAVTRQVIGIGLIFLVVMAFLHLRFPADTAIENGLNGLGGGLLGAALAWGLIKAFGGAGRLVVLLALTLVGGILVTGLSFAEGLAWWGERLLGSLRRFWAWVVDFVTTVQGEDEPVPAKTKGGKGARLEPQAGEGPKSAPVIHLLDSAVPQSAAAREGLGPGREGSGTGREGFGAVRDGYAKPGGSKEAPGSKDSRQLPGAGDASKDPDKWVMKVKPTRQVGPEAGGKPGEEPKPDKPVLITIDSKPVYQLPPATILIRSNRITNLQAHRDIAERTKILEDTLESFGVKARVVEIHQGPAITRYEVQPAPGIRVSKITQLADDLALAMAAPDVRIEAPIPGKAAVGIEVPNREISPVYLRDVLESPEFRDAPSKLTVVFGKDIAGRPVVGNLEKMLHLLIAGATGSGKSVCINSIISSLLFKARPDEVKLMMVDPKMVELNNYNGIPHLIAPVVTDPKKAAGFLRWAVNEMENRYEVFAAAGVRDIQRYNQMKAEESADSPTPALPYIVVVVDELADLMMVAPVDVEDAICRLAQMARAAGIHLVVATQRPSVDVITGLIKANIPSRIAFAVASQVDSRTILDMGGAEKLLGKGDMLFFPVGASKPIRAQGAFVSEKEVEGLVGFVKKQGTPEYRAEAVAIEENGSTERGGEPPDEVFKQAVRVVIEHGQASVSILQRRLRISYNKAARLIDDMEERGLIGPYMGSKPRDVLLSMEDYARIFGPERE